MNYSEEELKRISEFAEKYIRSYETSEAANVPVIADKLSHIRHVEEMARRNWPGNEAVAVAAKIHDIGRFMQWQALGKFNDREKLHHEFGIDTIKEGIRRGILTETPELDMIKTVVQYHGRTGYIEVPEKIPEDVMEIVDIIGRIDGIENGCVGAVGYLIREAKEDAKGYKEQFIKSQEIMPSNEEINVAMRQVSPEVLEFFKQGEKFDKMKYCKTYADYTLFAAILAIQGLKGKDRDLALDAMQNYECSRPIVNKDGKPGKKVYKNAIDGYRDIFSKLIDPRYQKVAMDVLEGFYKDPNYEYREEPDGLDGH